MTKAIIVDANSLSQFKKLSSGNSSYSIVTERIENNNTIARYRGYQCIQGKLSE